MNRINIKPLSVNDAYRGRKYKTKEHNNYIYKVISQLKKIELSKPPYSLNYEFGFSSTGSDIDNAIKPITDILQKRYSFNDNQVYELHAIKKIVKKGNEYIKFTIKSIKIDD